MLVAVRRQFMRDGHERTSLALEDLVLGRPAWYCFIAKVVLVML